MKTFYCIHCRAERPIEQKVVRSGNVRCKTCQASRQQFQKTGVYIRNKTVGHKQDSWAEDALPQDIIERHAESIAD